MNEVEWQPTFAPLFTLIVELVRPIAVGACGAGDVRVIPFREGSFHGPSLRGRILDGGTDWQDVRPDRVLEISARYLLETDEGERIEVRSNGLRGGSAEAIARLERGEHLSADEYYFRTAIRLRTAAPRLARLNDVLAFSRGERFGRGVRLQVFELK